MLQFPHLVTVSVLHKLHDWKLGQWLLCSQTCSWFLKNTKIYVNTEITVEEKTGNNWKTRRESVQHEEIFEYSQKKFWWKMLVHQYCWIAKGEQNLSRYRQPAEHWIPGVILNTLSLIPRVCFSSSIISFKFTLEFQCSPNRRNFSHQKCLKVQSYTQSNSQWIEVVCFYKRHLCHTKDVNE
jgi:hypothetical protein